MLGRLKEKSNKMAIGMNLDLTLLNQVNDSFPSLNRDVFGFENSKRSLHPDNPTLTKELDFVKVHFEQLSVQLLSQTNLTVSVGNSKTLRQNSATCIRWLSAPGNRAKGCFGWSVDGHAAILHNV